MGKLVMGRNGTLVPLNETAKMLEVSIRQLRYMVRQGRILPVPGRTKGEPMLFRLEEIHALIDLKGRRIDLAAVAGLATQAHSLGRSAIARLDKLCQFLGLENNRLQDDEDHVMSLHMKAQDALQQDLSELEPPTILYWASTFNAIDESYLRAVERHIEDTEPWSTYLALACALMEQQPTAPDTNLKFAYACLDSARKHLRHTSYFFARTKSGTRLADEAFADGVDEEIISQLYPTVPWAN